MAFPFLSQLGTRIQNYIGSSARDNPSSVSDLVNQGQPTPSIGRTIRGILSTAGQKVQEIPERVSQAFRPTVSPLPDEPDIRTIFATPTQAPTATPTQAPTQAPTRMPQQAPQGQQFDSGLIEKVRQEYPMIKRIADAYGVPVEVLLSQYFQESSFGTNPQSMVENAAGAMGPLQITRQTARGGYPAFPDLAIPLEDRGNLDQSMDFAAKHYRRLTDYYGSPQQAISAYYGDPSYYDTIMENIDKPEFQALLQLLGGGE